MNRTRLIIGSAVGAGLTAGAFAQAQKDWQAPDITKLPDDKYGQMVRQGKGLMQETDKLDIVLADEVLRVPSGVGAGRINALSQALTHPPNTPGDRHVTHRRTRCRNRRHARRL